MQPYATFEDAMQAVQNNEADVLAVYHNNIFDARSHGFSTTNAFATLKMTELTRKGTQTIRTIAVPSRDINIVKSKRQGSSLSAELKGYDSAATGFEALKNGSVDALVCEMPAATWISEQRPHLRLQPGGPSRIYLGSYRRRPQLGPGAAQHPQ
jgi:ABC-type amino acid transport substrate-binding protein